MVVVVVIVVVVYLLLTDFLDIKHLPDMPCADVHPIISCFIKIQNGLSFWCQLTQLVQVKGH